MADHELALRPLYAWAEPLVRPFRDTVVALLAERARTDGATFDEKGLRASIDRTFTTSLVGLTHRALLVDLGAARKVERLHAASAEARFAEFVRDIGSAPGQARIERAFPEEGQCLFYVRGCQRIISKNITAAPMPGYRTLVLSTLLIFLDSFLQ